jgi:hypothetical protein
MLKGFTPYCTKMEHCALADHLNWRSIVTYDTIQDTTLYIKEPWKFK